MGSGLEMSALAAMKDELPRTLAFALNERDYPDSGLLCGGRLEIFVEPIVEPRLVLFGGGHVSAAIARLARGIGFHVTVADDREEFADPGVGDSVACSDADRSQRGTSARRR